MATKTIKGRDQKGRAATLTRTRAGELWLGSLVSLAALADKLKLPEPLVGTLLVVMRDSLPALPVESLVAVYDRLGPVKGGLGKRARALLALLKTAPPLGASKPSAAMVGRRRGGRTLARKSPRQAVGRRH